MVIEMVVLVKQFEVVKGEMYYVKVELEMFKGECKEKEF